MRYVLRISSVALLMLGMTAGWSSAQELKPGIRFGAEGAADWADDDSWAPLIADDPGVAPGSGDVASIQNGGTAMVSTAVPQVDALGITDGGVNIAAGGTLDILGAVTIGDDGSLDLGGSLNAATFSSTGSLTLNGGMITASGPAMLGGSIDIPSLPATGTSIPFLTSTSLRGQPSSITVGGAAASLDRGLGLQVEFSGGTSSVGVGSIPIAVVDRTTGNVTVENAAGGSMEVKGYELLSNGGRLAVDNWNSLTDQGADGWAEVPSSDGSALTEVNLTSSSTLAVGDSVDFGAAWAGTSVAPRAEDLAINVLLADGRTIPGAVEYTGAANDLVLNIDPATGAATLQHQSPNIGDFDLVGYSILSESGSLNVDGFTGTIGAGFSKPNPQAIALAEITLEDPTTVSNGTVIDLGNIFTPGASQDIVFQYGEAGSLTSATGTVQYASVVTLCNPDTLGDVNGSSMVDFADFLILSGNFGTAVADHTGGDINCSGEVDFSDFLILSANFGTTVGGAASVPEPSTGLMLLVGILGMLRFRKRGVHVAAVAVAAGLMMTATPGETFAQNIETRFVRIHPEGANNQINNTTEMRNIFAGTVLDVIINEDITAATTDVVDFAGGDGSFNLGQLPYLNGVADDSMNDFGQYISGTFMIPEGDWTVGFGRDDGGWLRLTDVTFDTTFNEQGATVDGDGEILWEGTGGHNWTGGTFSVGPGGIETGLEAGFFERGGGDSWEVAIVDGLYDAEADGDRNAFFANFGIELEPNGVWELTGPFVPQDPNDLNSDGNVNADDLSVILDNWGTYGFDDVFALSQAVGGGAAGAASVPEPASNLLILSAIAMLFGIRRRRS